MPAPAPAPNAEELPAQAPARSSSFVRAASTVGLGIFSSRTLGLIRDILTASLIGTSGAASAFSIAFTLPNLFRRLLGEGALAAGLVPLFSEELVSGDRERAWRKAGKVLSVAAVLLLGLTLAGMAICWIGMRIAIPGSRLSMVFSYSLGLLPYMPMICLVGLSMGLLNACGHFFIPSFTPVLLNVSWILAALVICPFLPAAPYNRAWGLVWGILIGGVIQAAVQVPVLMKKGWRPKWDPDWHDPFVRNVFRLAAPAVLGLSVTQLNVVVDRTLAGYLSEYAASSLFYAERLIYLPLGLVGTALGTVALPSMSRLYSEGNHSSMVRIFHKGLGLILFWTLPASVGLFWLGNDIVQLIYERGQFDQSSSAQVVWALKFYTPGLVAFSALKVIIPAFYAMKDTITPVRVAWLALLLNLVLNLILMQWLEHGGLALATSISAWVNCGMLLWLLRKRWGRPIFQPMASSIFHCIIACCVMMVGGSLFLGLIDPLLANWGGSVLGQLVRVGTGIGAAGACYLLTHVLIRFLKRVIHK